MCTGIDWCGEKTLYQRERKYGGNVDNSVHVYINCLQTEILQKSIKSVKHNLILLL